MPSILAHFKWAILFTLAAIAAVGLTTRSWELVGITCILGVLEVSLSFDNAVVNAGVLKNMTPQWQQRFLTWGILIAVFGMRLVIPVVIVAVFGGLMPWDAFTMAFTDGHRYGEILHSAHAEIAGFGGMFLAMVFISFIIEEREITWLAFIEKPLAKLGQLKSLSTLLGISLIPAVMLLAPVDHRVGVMVSMIAGLAIYLLVDMIADRMEGDDDKQVMNQVAKAGLASFIYLEVLDASFSFDGVIGAFALSSNILIIMTGLAIGAFFVRSLTVFLVRGGHLDELPHLEHAAHYAIGVLATVMFLKISYEIPELFTGLVGAGLIVLGYITSRIYMRRHPEMQAAD